MLLKNNIFSYTLLICKYLFLPIATDGVSPAALTSTRGILPARTGIPTADQLLKDPELELMDYEDYPSDTSELKSKKQKETNKLTLSRNNKKPTRKTSPSVVSKTPTKTMNTPPTRREDLLEESITSYQIPQPDPKEPTTNEIPDHLFEDLCSHLQSKSYYDSRVAVFEGFERDGPFPSITHLKFDQDDPSTGLTMTFASALGEKTKQFKKDICLIHAKNFHHLAEIEQNKITTLIKTANEIFDPKAVEETLKRAKIQAFNKAREIRRNKNKRRNHNNPQGGNKRRRSPSRGRERERQQR